MSDYNVLVVGAGMVGLTMAKLLTEQGLSVAIFDKHAPTADPKPDDLLRVSAISRASENIFRHLGCWDDTMLIRASAYEHMHVWDTVGGGEIKFDAAAIGQANLGHIIPNTDIQRSLWQALEYDSNATLLTGVELTKAEWLSDSVQLTLASGSQYQGQLAIAADGANSWLRSQAGIAVQSKAYDHTALVANIRTSESHGFCARQAFLTSGPLAFLPTQDRHQCSIVWSSDEQEIKSLLAMSETDFNSALTDAFGNEPLGELSCSSKRLSFPLVGRHAENYIRPRLALIGDAAHTIHPLAGQGANIGLLDAASLAEIIAQLQETNSPYFDVPHLRPYERWRRSENQLMLDTMRGFRELFSGETSMKSTMRSFGMSQLNRLPLLKKPIIESAMGIRGDLPNVARTPMPEI